MEALLINQHSPNFEARLVSRFRQGDSEALSTLFDMYVDQVYGYARHILGNKEDAEEITSEAFVKAFRHAADFRGDAPFKSWLFGITRNLCRDRFRQTRFVIVDVDDHSDLLIEDRRTLLDTVYSDVRYSLRDLPEEYQDILILCDVEQWDASEAAEIIGKSLSATKSLLYRARRALREKLTQTWENELHV